jgi:hypothetical protein
MIIPKSVCFQAFGLPERASVTTLVLAVKVLTLMKFRNIWYELLDSVWRKPFDLLTQCGGAHSRARPSRRRRQRHAPEPSNTTGAQTAKRRKAGSRITSKDAFGEGGRVLNENASDQKAGTGFRKQAGR